MQVTPITMDAARAEELYRQYLKDAHYDEPEDAAIRATYRALAKGQTVIKALESVAAAGCDEHGMPRLAIMRADQRHCYLRITGGTVRMGANEERSRGYRARGYGGPMPFEWPTSAFAGIKSKDTWHEQHRAVLPIVPRRLRPKRALRSYHILWEAEWQRVVPRDPYLLRRLGTGDLWLVVAAWDLTEVERAALEHRVMAN